MSTTPVVELAPITPADLVVVGEFLHAHLDARLTADGWTAAIHPSWPVEQPNHGFLLRDGDLVVGVYLAFYSDRTVDGDLLRFCNLAAWCVLDGYRSHGVRLLRAMLGQRGYHFTDLSPSGNVVAMNTRLGFAHLDTRTALVVNAPWPLVARGVRIVTDAQSIESALTGQDLQIYRDHARARAARHLVVVAGGEPCYVVYRRVRRRRLPWFATILHVTDPELFGSVAPHVFRHLLLRDGIPLTLAELRVVGPHPARSVARVTSRPKMYRSPNLRADQVDDLYSELTCVPW